MADDDYQSRFTRPVTAQPYRGPRRRHRETGRIEYWTEHAGYQPEGSLELLTPPERAYVQEQRQRADDVLEQVRLMDRWEKLNATQPTGALPEVMGNIFGMRDKPMIPAADVFGWRVGQDPELEEMRGIQSRWAPRERVSGSGSSTDRDIDLFAAGVPGINRSGPANQRLIALARQRARDEMEYSEFLEEHHKRMRSLTGAQEVWQSYTRLPPEQRRYGWRETIFGEPLRPRGVPQTARWDAQRRRWVP
jgi:hypothetical protein